MCSDKKIELLHLVLFAWEGWLSCMFSQDISSLQIYFAAVFHHHFNSLPNISALCLFLCRTMLCTELPNGWLNEWTIFHMLRVEWRNQLEYYRLQIFFSRQFLCHCAGNVTCNRLLPIFCCSKRCDLNPCFDGELAFSLAPRFC